MNSSCPRSGPGANRISGVRGVNGRSDPAGPRFWRSGRIVRVGTPDAPESFRVIARFWRQRGRVRSETILPERHFSPRGRVPQGMNQAQLRRMGRVGRSELDRDRTGVRRRPHTDERSGSAVRSRPGRPPSGLRDRMNRMIGVDQPHGGGDRPGRGQSTVQHRGRSDGAAHSTGTSSRKIREIMRKRLDAQRR